MSKYNTFPLQLDFRVEFADYVIIDSACTMQLLLDGKITRIPKAEWEEPPWKPLTSESEHSCQLNLTYI